MIARILLVAVLALVVATPAESRSVNKRQKHQAARIDHGEANGRLSPQEADRLRGQEAGIASEEKAMRDAHGGHLTTSERHLLNKSARMEGFLVFDYEHRSQEAVDRLASWIRGGKLRYREEFLDGLDQAPGAIAALYRGENLGKRLIRVDRG